MATALARRHELLHVVGENDEPDLIVVLDRAERQERADLHRDLALQSLACAEITRRTHIDDEHDG